MKTLVKDVIAAIPQILKLRQNNIWLSYDGDADVLYMNFKRPSQADDSKLLNNDVLVRYEGGEIVGLTVLNASQKRKVN